MSQQDLSGKQAYGTSQSSRGAFHASRSVQPGAEKARKMTATSGQKCFDSSRSSGPLGLLVKTLLVSQAWSSPFVNLCWSRDPVYRERKTRFTKSRDGSSSTESLKILKKSDIPSKHLIYRLVPLVPCMKEKGYSLWPTPTASQGEKCIRPLCPTEETLDHGVMLNAAVFDSLQEDPLRMWPTPRAHEVGDYQYSRGDRNKPTLTLTGAVRLWPTPTTARPHDSDNTAGRDLPGQNQMSLARAVMMFPTPSAQDGRNSMLPPSQADRDTLIGELIRQGGAGYVNPLWEEWLMGLPPGWTELNVSGTRSSRNKSTRSSKRSGKLKPE